MSLSIDARQFEYNMAEISQMEPQKLHCTRQSSSKFIKNDHEVLSTNLSPFVQGISFDFHDLNILYMTDCHASQTLHF